MSADFTLNAIPVGQSQEDDTSPTLSSGTLSTPEINSSGFTVSFTQATDNLTQDADIKYLLYTSTSDNIDTLSNVLANGILQSQGTGVSQLQVSGLNGSTQYYYNIIAEDEGGNQVAYLSNDVTTLSSGGTGLDSREGDEAALEALFTDTNGGSWDNSTGWASSGMSLSNNIYGVETQSINGELRVVAIKLNGSTGFIDPYIEGSSGSNGGNNLTGTLPAEIGNLKECIYFNVKQNYITGAIPSELNNMVSLKFAGFNGQKADINSVDPHHPGKQGDYYATERSNNFTGAFPEIPNLDLIYLEIEGRGNIGDGLTSMPNSVGQNVNIEGIHFGNNNLTALPNLGSLSKLVNISFGYQNYIGDNDFEGLRDYGFPQWLNGTNMPDLARIWAEHVDGIGGTITDFSACKDMENFSFTSGGIDGPFPAYFLDGTFPNINMIQLTWNNLTGTFPEIKEDNNLVQLSIDGNELTGPIHPSWETGAPAMKNFGIGWMNLDGEIPDLTHMFQLRYLRAQSNNFTGTVPLIDVNNSALNSFEMGNNQMSGYIDPVLADIGLLPRMGTDDFDISSNNFSTADKQDLIDAMNANGTINVLKQ